MDAIKGAGEKKLEKSGSDPITAYAIGVADSSYNWYRSRAILTRRTHRLSEIILLIISAAIPVSAVLSPNNATTPAILGALIVVLSGVKSAFHWHENFLRFSGAREAVESERRLYHTGSSPYDDPATRDQTLVAMISKIEQDEMTGWTKIASARPQQ